MIGNLRTQARRVSRHAERIAVEHHREIVRYFGEDDPTSRVMMEGILANEEEHSNDMHDLLVAHEGSR